MSRDVTIWLCGAERPIRFNWAAFARLRERFGVQFQDEVNRALAEQDAEALAHILAIGAGGAVTADQILIDSPPMMEGLAVVSVALRYGYNGPTVKGIERPLAQAVARMRAALAAMFTPRPSAIGLAA